MNEMSPEELMFRIEMMNQIYKVLGTDKAGFDAKIKEIVKHPRKNKAIINKIKNMMKGYEIYE